MKKNIVEKLVDLQQKRWAYYFAHCMLSLLSLEIPVKVRFGRNVRFIHRAPGTVIHPSTRIGDDVQIYQGVTIGISHAWNDIYKDIQHYRIDIQDRVILCAGSKILCKKTLTVGKGTIVAANAVLTTSTGENEIWAGIPAKKIADRID